MRRTISMLLCFCLLLSMAGCTQNTPNQTTENQTSTTTTETEGALSPSTDFSAPLLAVSVPFVTDATEANDGNIIFTYTAQNIFLTYEDQDVAAAITLDYHNRLDFDNSYAPTVLQAAMNNYASQTDWQPYSYRVIVNPQRLDANLLSLYGTRVFFNGTPQSTISGFSMNYDLLTGKCLELRDVLVTTFSAEDLSSLINNALAASNQSSILFADYSFMVTDMFSTNTPVDSWYLAEDGMHFFFAPMDIAPNNAGIIDVAIPYEKLTGILRNGYFPTEQIALIGTPVLQPFESVSTNRFAHMTELVIDAQGNEYLLYTDGALQNVRIESGIYNDDGSFAPDGTVFAAATICSSDALMLQTAQPGDLRLTYTQNGSPISINMEALLSK